MAVTVCANCQIICCGYMRLGSKGWAAVGSLCSPVPRLGTSHVVLPWVGVNVIPTLCELHSSLVIPHQQSWPLKYRSPEERGRLWILE